MQTNPKFKAIEESFEGHQAGAVDGLTRDTVVEAVEQVMDEPPDEPTKEHQIQLAGDLPDFDEGTGANAPPFETEEPKQGKTIVFPKKKEKKAAKAGGGSMKALFAKFGSVDKKMIFGFAGAAVVFGAVGFMAYEMHSMELKVNRLEAGLARARTDAQRHAAPADAGVAGGVNAQVVQAIDNLNQRLVRLEQAPAPRAEAPAHVAAAPAAKAGAKKLAAKAKPAGRELASVKKGKTAKKRR